MTEVKEQIAEYDSVRGGGSGMIDMSARGRIRVGGTEAVQFLNGLISNDMKALAENSWMPAIFANVQGRLIAAVRVIRLEDDPEKSQPGFLLDTEPATRDRVLKSIERFTLAGDFRVEDVTDGTVQLSLQGGRADAVVRSLFGDDVVGMAKNGVAQVVWDGT